MPATGTFTFDPTMTAGCDSVTPEEMRTGSATDCHRWPFPATVAARSSGLISGTRSDADTTVFSTIGARFPVGIMVETPSAAMIADRLALEADFFSVGTNDLIQYSLAIDRQNRDVAYLYRPLHLSVLRMLQQIVSAARASGIPVAMCGEMAGDPVYTLILLALGFDELSMTAGQIPVVKGIIRKASRADAVQILEQAMSYSTAEEIERYVRVEVEKRFTMDPR